MFKIPKNSAKLCITFLGIIYNPQPASRISMKIKSILWWGSSGHTLLRMRYPTVNFHSEK